MTEMLAAGRARAGRADRGAVKVVMMVMHHHISWLISQKIQHLVVEPVRRLHQLSDMVLYNRHKLV